MVEKFQIKISPSAQKLRRTVLLLFHSFIVGLIGSSSNALPTLASDQAFDSFWQKFKIALKKGDKQAVVSMTKLPFLFDSKQLGKAAFLAKYDKIFPKSISTCLEKEKPIKDNKEFSFFCDETIYVMGKQKNGQYMFTDIGAND